jgi:hypothetical protein
MEWATIEQGLKKIRLLFWNSEGRAKGTQKEIVVSHDQALIQ